MKTIIYKVLILSFFCLFGIVQVRGHEVSKEQSLTTTINPQFPYRSSIGGMFSPFAVGVSFKTSLKENIFLQTELTYNVKVIWDIYLYAYVSVESNTNVMYQKKLKDKKNSELFWFIGGGVNLGYNIMYVSGKFGVNPIIGLEYLFKNKPLSFQIDLRPGYGLLFNPNYKGSGTFFLPEKMPFSHFDCLLAFTFRRTYKKQ